MLGVFRRPIHLRWPIRPLFSKLALRASVAAAGVRVECERRPALPPLSPVDCSTERHHARVPRFLAGIRHPPIPAQAVVLYDSATMDVIRHYGRKPPWQF